MLNQLLRCRTNSPPVASLAQITSGARRVACDRRSRDCWRRLWLASSLCRRQAESRGGHTSCVRRVMKIMVNTPPKPCRRPSDGRDINIRPSRYGYHCYLYTLPSSGGTSKRGTPTYPHIHCLISSRQGSSARVGAPIMSSRRDPRSASRLQYHLARRTGLPPALLPRAGAVARGAMGSERHVRQRR